MNKPTSSLPQRQLTKKQMVRRTVLSLSVFVLLGVLAVATFNWVRKQPRDGGTPKPLRKALTANERVFSALFDSNKLVREYPVSAAAKNVRVNGDLGMDGRLDTATWRLHVVRSKGDTLTLSLNDIMKLPKKEIIFDFKCIEGWSQVTHWGGVPLKTFMEVYGLREEKEKKYIGLQTPDKEYYVGIDMPSAVHPQTLLCYEMNGKPLPDNQGYPLRLIIPVKYGIKHLKRIGTVFFSDTKPSDYWAERGYDYYAGH